MACPLQPCESGGVLLPTASIPEDWPSQQSQLDFQPGEHIPILAGPCPLPRSAERAWSHGGAGPASLPRAVGGLALHPRPMPTLPPPSPVSLLFDKPICQRLPPPRAWAQCAFASCFFGFLPLFWLFAAF